MRGSWATVKTVAPLVFVCACAPRSLEPSPDGGPGSVSAANKQGASGSAPAGGDGGTGVAGGGAGVVGGSGHGGSPAGGASTSAAMCPAGPDRPPAEAPVQTPPTIIPTRVPFSCAPLPEAFIFPPPASDRPGLFGRCASFSVGPATAVTLSPDGHIAALVTGDGIVRVVELASRQVVAVLSSPRAMIDHAAFAPDGRSILTMARAQREVTLWQTSDWAPPAPVWTVALPGHRYDLMFGGGLAFAPDGRSAVASPGSGVFLLDVARGTIRASQYADSPVLDVAYGFDGTRIVVAIPSLVAPCVQAPNGGVVALLDDALRSIGALADLGTYPGWRGLPAFRVSPAADLVLVAPGAEDAAGLRAFRLSDGASLPPPPLDALPLAFMPDGQTVLVSRGGAVQHVRVADGAGVLVVAPGAATGPVGVSADGSVVAFGGGGDTLLRAWRPGGAIASVCAAEAPADGGQSSSLSADGQLLALALGSSVRVVRRADGNTLMRLPSNPATQYARVDLSPRGKYAAIAPNWNTTGGAAVVKLPAGGTVATFVPDTSGWLDFLFTPAEDRLYSIGKRASDDTFGAFEFTLDSVDLASNKVMTRVVPAYTALLGVSLGCPVLYSDRRGVWRSCDGCDDTPVAGPTDGNLFGPANAVLSADGMFVAVAGSEEQPGVTLWRLWPDPARLVTIGVRAEDAAWTPQEFPVAVTSGAARILTGARRAASCTIGPEFEVYVRDGSGRQVLDTLPPGVTAVDASARTIAYGPHLWCAR
jgi:WD40 repeat protein